MNNKALQNILDPTKRLTFKGNPQLHVNGANFEILTEDMIFESSSVNVPADKPVILVNSGLFQSFTSSTDLSKLNVGETFFRTTGYYFRGASDFRTDHFVSNEKNPPKNLIHATDRARVNFSLYAFEPSPVTNTFLGTVRAESGAEVNFGAAGGAITKDSNATIFGSENTELLVANDGGKIFMGWVGDGVKTYGSIIASGEKSLIDVWGYRAKESLVLGRSLESGARLLAYSTDKAEINLLLDGYSPKVQGNLVVNKGATLKITTSGDLSGVRAITSWTHEGGINETPTENDNAHLIINLVDPNWDEFPELNGGEGLNFQGTFMDTPIAAMRSNSTITVNVKGKNARTRGAKSIGSVVDGVRYGGNTITLNYTGENSGANVATFEALADNLLEANFGNSTYFYGRVYNRGQMQLHFASGSA